MDKAKKLVICCSRGINSKEVAENLTEEGLDAVSLERGYIAWLMDVMKNSQDEDFAKNVEISLRKKFKKKIWSKFTKAINTYELVKPGDKIAVCISGGKDSMLMAKCFQELKLHNKFDFDIKEYPIPPVGDDDILVKVEGCGVCGTDAHEFKRDPFNLIPVALGHEGTGEIVAMGKNVKTDTAGS